MYSSRRQSGPPSWFVFIIGFALVFGAFRLWIGIQDFFQESGLAFPTATISSNLVLSDVNVESTASSNPLVTAYPTMTAIPTCQDYLVRSNSGVINVRSQPNTVASVLETFTSEQVVCVLERQGEWYLIDRDTRTRRIEEGYVFNNLLETANPTPTPSNTAPPAPTITLTPTATATATPTNTATP